MPIDSKKAALIFLGAREFPNSKNFQASEAFSQAKNRINDYFQDKIGLDQAAILDLFDSSQSPNHQDTRISKFINDRRAAGVEDLFIYYVGHGGFSDGDNNFYLATQSTTDRNPGISSITLRALANTINQDARFIRTFMILDCCFAAAAGKSFMAGTMEGPFVQLADAFETTKGVALLCAASKDLPAFIIHDRNITMFTEGLDLALNKGDSRINNRYLSLRQINNLTYLFIRSQNQNNGIKPELISPVQIQGDIADLPHFENFAYDDSIADIVAKRREIEGEMIKNNLPSLGNLFMDFVRNFDQTGKKNNTSVLLCSECYEIWEDRDSTEKGIFRNSINKIYAEMLQIIDDIVKENMDSNS